MGVTIKKKIKIKRKRGRPKGTTTHDWDSLLQRYLAENLNPNRHQAYTLGKLAREYGISKQVVINWAAKHGWVESLRKAKAERGQQAVAAITTQAAFNEVEVRTRHALIAREGLDLALRRLRTITLEQLEVKDAIALLSLMKEERAALGLPAKFSKLPDASDADGETYRSVEDHMAQHNRYRELGTKLLNLIEGTARRVN